MSYTKACVCAFLFYCVFNSYHCLRVIPERAEVIFHNKEYFEDTPILNVRRYSRKGDYVINLVFTSKKVLNNTVAVDIVFYQYLHNEFRRSFPELHFKLCDLINDDPFIGKTVRIAGLTTCPIAPGRHGATNMTFNNKFSFKWPYESGMVEASFKTAKGELLGKGIAILTFKEG